MLPPFLPRIQLAGSNYVSSVARKTLAGNGRRMEEGTVRLRGKKCSLHPQLPLATIFITDAEHDLSLFEGSAAVMPR